MALAKLLILHRRTDFWQTMRMYNRLMRPSYYEQSDWEAAQSIAKLFLREILQGCGCDSFLR